MLLDWEETEVVGESIGPENRFLSHRVCSSGSRAILGSRDILVAIGVFAEKEVIQ